MSGSWDLPVTVMVGSNTTHHVTRPSAAADLLLHDWPEFHGPAYERAKVALLKALDDPGSDDLSTAARLAFEEAAREASILVRWSRDENYAQR